MEGLGILNDNVSVEKEYLNVAKQTIKTKQAKFIVSLLHAYSATHYRARDHSGYNTVQYLIILDRQRSNRIV